MRFPIKIVYNFDEEIYYVFAEQYPSIEGCGLIEQEAVEDFFAKLEKIINTDV